MATNNQSNTSPKYSPEEIQGWGYSPRLAGDIEGIVSDMSDRGYDVVIGPRARARTAAMADQNVQEGVGSAKTQHFITRRIDQSSSDEDAEFNKFWNIEQTPVAYEDSARAVDFKAKDAKGNWYKQGSEFDTALQDVLKRRGWVQPASDPDVKGFKKGDFGHAEPEDSYSKLNGRYKAPSRRLALDAPTTRRAPQTPMQKRMDAVVTKAAKNHSSQLAAEAVANDPPMTGLIEDNPQGISYYDTVAKLKKIATERPPMTEDEADQYRNYIANALRVRTREEMGVEDPVKKAVYIPGSGLGAGMISSGGAGGATVVGEIGKGASKRLMRVWKGLEGKYIGPRDLWGGGASKPPAGARYWSDQKHIAKRYAKTYGGEVAEGEIPMELADKTFKRKGEFAIPESNLPVPESAKSDLSEISETALSEMRGWLEEVYGHQDEFIDWIETASKSDIVSAIQKKFSGGVSSFLSTL